MKYTATLCNASIAFAAHIKFLFIPLNVVLPFLFH
jgi:hypothetical protein